MTFVLWFTVFALYGLFLLKVYSTEVYSELCQTSNIELFANIKYTIWAGCTICCCILHAWNKPMFSLDCIFYLSALSFSQPLLSSPEYIFNILNIYFENLRVVNFLICWEIFKGIKSVWNPLSNQKLHYKYFSIIYLLGKPASRKIWKLRFNEYYVNQSVLIFISSRCI